MAIKVSEKLQQAMDNLIINDVYLKNSKAHCDDDFDPKSTDQLEGLLVQQMHVVHKSEVVKIEDDGELLRVFIRLGSRWVYPTEAEEPEVKAFIEGDFIAEYKIADSLEQACIDEFAMKNASFHVWPYWREFLSSHCERMRLPRVVLPTVQLNK